MAGWCFIIFSSGLLTEDNRLFPFWIMIPVSKPNASNILDLALSSAASSAAQQEWKTEQNSSCWDLKVHAKSFAHETGVCEFGPSFIWRKCSPQVWKLLLIQDKVHCVGTTARFALYIHFSNKLKPQFSSHVNLFLHLYRTLVHTQNSFLLWVLCFCFWLQNCPVARLTPASMCH